jgi:hypothetical protein
MVLLQSAVKDDHSLTQPLWTYKAMYFLRPVVTPVVTCRATSHLCTNPLDYLHLKYPRAPISEITRRSHSLLIKPATEVPPQDQWSPPQCSLFLVSHWV